MAIAKEFFIEISEIKPPKEVTKAFNYIVALLYSTAESADRVAVSCNPCRSFDQAYGFALGLEAGVKIWNRELPVSIEYIDFAGDVSYFP